MRVDSPVILTEGLGKAYHVYEKPEDRLKQALSFGCGRYYREFWALREVSVAIAAGETVGIVGRNGSGKSTFLQLVSGVLAPTEGRVATQGRVVALLELGSGFNPDFTGRENVYLTAAILGLSRAETEARFDAIAAFAEIGDFIEQPVKHYSSGMYARLAFAVAAHVDADILIVDEILAVGDAAFSQKCMRFMRAFKERGTLLFVSHDAGAVISLCDRALWLDGGRLRAQGPAKEVCRRYLEDLQAAEPKPARPARRPKRPLPSAVAEVLKGGRMSIGAFDPEAPWHGYREASILDARLWPDAAPERGHIEPEEPVTLTVTARAHTLIHQPIIGFALMDAWGREIFGQNTLDAQSDEASLMPDDEMTAEFRFVMPCLHSGRYSLTFAVAAGDQFNHLRHHWIDEAITLEVEGADDVVGMIAWPMAVAEG